MKRDIAPAGIRFPAELKEQLQKAAHKSQRSMNAEVVARIAESFEGRNDLRQFSDSELVEEVIKRWGRESVYFKLPSAAKSPEDEIIRKYRVGHGKD